MRRKKKIDVALIGSNFALKGYLPVLEKIKELNVKIICSKNIFEKKELTKKKNIQLETNWKAIFDSNIQLIILSVPPKVQEKILLYNLRYKKKIFLEKPISTNYELSKKIYDQYKKRGIKFDINLTYLNHKLFNDLKKIIKSKLLGKILAYDIQWSFLSYDYFNTIKSWKTNETYGGGIKNIFLTHVLSYCEYLFGDYKIKNFETEKSNNLIKNYKKKIILEIENKKNIRGKAKIFIKKNGTQKHIIKIFFEKGHVLLFTNSKDWTKSFSLEIYKKNNKKKMFKLIKDSKYTDGRCYQIENAIRKFLRPGYKNNMKYCLNAEKNIKKII